MGRELTLPSERLVAAAKLAAASFWKTPSAPRTAIDVGCDHAKLAIYLVQSGLCRHVTATDINAGPVEKAKRAVAARKLCAEPLDRYITVRTGDGLAGLENVPADWVFILGMGGETIADILKKADAFRASHPDTLYLLQAMTSESDLRRFLAESGYAVLREQPVTDKGRVYMLMSCRYDGVRRTFPESLLLAGTDESARLHPLYPVYLQRRIRILQKTVCALEKAGLDCEAGRRTLSELRALLPSEQNS